MEKWYWIELIGFDNTQSDYGVKSFLDRTCTKVCGVSLLFSNAEFVCDHISADQEIILEPCHCSYSGQRYSEERERQDWTNHQLKGLIKELQKNGVKVLFSIFDFFSYKDKSGKLFEGGFISQNREILIQNKDGVVTTLISVLKRLKDGSYFEDYFIEKAKEVVDYYNFDGVQFADGISSFRLTLENGDFSNDLVDQFLTYSKINDKNIPNDYKKRRDYILTNYHKDWIIFSSNRWEAFYDKIYAKFQSKILVFNSTWTRDVFESIVRYGLDYKKTLKENCYALMVEEVSATSPIFGVEDRGGFYLKDSEKPPFHYEFALMQQSIKAYLPTVKQISLSPIKDTCEQWDIIRHSPMEQERAIFRRNNNFVFDGKEFINCSDGPFYCLSSSMEATDWKYLNKKEEISVGAKIFGTVGFLAVFAEKTLYREIENYISTHNYSSTELKTSLFGSGLCIDGSVRLEDISRVKSPLLITNPELYSEKDFERLKKVKNKMLVVSCEKNLDNFFNPVFKSDYLNIYSANIKLNESEFDKLKKYAKLQKCTQGYSQKQGGIWTHPLKYNKFSMPFFKNLSKTANKAFNLPYIISKHTDCAVTTFRLGQNKYRVLVSNNEYNYILPKIKMPFKIKSARSLSKYHGYEIVIDDEVFCNRIPPRGLDIVEIEGKIYVED